jgi:hypothetical protein
MMSRRKKAMADVFTLTVFALFFTLVMLIDGTIFAYTSWSMQERRPAPSTPSSTGENPDPIGFFLLLCRLWPTTSATSFPGQRRRTMIEMSPEFVSIAMFAVILLGLSLGAPVFAVLGGTAAIFAYLGMGPEGGTCSGAHVRLTTNKILMAIPLFNLMAAFLSQSEISVGLFKGMIVPFGPMNGGIALASS